MTSAAEIGGDDAASRAQRMAEIQEAIRRDPRSRPSGLRAGLHGLGLLLVAGIPGVYAWMHPSLLHWVLYWTLATLACASTPAIIHEAFHRGLARNHFINDAFGSIVAGLNWSPLLCWKYFHFEHHANAGLANDAEVYPPTWSRLSMLGFPLGNWSFFLFLWKATWGTA